MMTEADYQEKLERIEAIFHARAGTQEHDELVRLVNEVEAYEREHYPIDPPTEAARLRFRAEQEGRA